MFKKEKSVRKGNIDAERKGQKNIITSTTEPTENKQRTNKEQTEKMERQNNLKSKWISS